MREGERKLKMDKWNPDPVERLEGGTWTFWDENTGDRDDV
jgi:hypothetical protein